MNCGILSLGASTEANIQPSLHGHHLHGLQETFVPVSVYLVIRRISCSIGDTPIHPQLQRVCAVPKMLAMSATASAAY